MSGADDWSSWLDAVLPVRDTDVGLRVTEVSDRRVRDGQETFSVVLAADEPGDYAQGTYTLITPEGESVEVFMVPISPTEFEAVFNRLIEETT